MENLRNQTGKEYISSCDHTDVIAGQVREDMTILFYMDGITKSMACF